MTDLRFVVKHFRAKRKERHQEKCESKDKLKFKKYFQLLMFTFVGFSFYLNCFTKIYMIIFFQHTLNQ